MGLETGSFIQDLVESNPPATDSKSQGDDHLRLLKTLLKATFPNASKAFYFPTTASKTANFTVVGGDMNKTFLIDTTAGNVTLTLPTLVAGDAGWEIAIIKTNTGTNPVFITPATGTIQSGDLSGLAKTRRCIPGKKTRVMWTGTAWMAERALTAPVGSILTVDRATLPVGYEWADGSVLVSGSYPDWFAAKGAQTTRDIRGRVVAGYDNVGTANRLTDLTGGVADDVLGDTGGEETHVISTAEMPSHTHVQDPHTHNIRYDRIGVDASGATQVVEDLLAAGPSDFNLAGGAQATTATNQNTGGGGAHNNIQPTIVLPRILVVE